jgi:hypothetical protein
MAGVSVKPDRTSVTLPLVSRVLGYGLVREHWLPELTATIGVWHDAALVARVLVARNNESGEPVPYLREIDPPPRSLACGD